MVVADQHDVNGGKLIERERRRAHAPRAEPSERARVPREDGIGQHRQCGRAKQKGRMADERRGDAPRGYAGQRTCNPHRNGRGPRHRRARAPPAEQIAQRPVGARMRIEEKLSIAMIGDRKPRHQPDLTTELTEITELKTNFSVPSVPPC